MTRYGGCGAYGYARIKRGATLRLRRRMAFDANLYDITSQARSGNTVANLEIRPVATGEAGIIEISAPATETANWPLGRIEMDIRAELIGSEGREVVFSDTIVIEVVEEITRP